MSKTWLIGLVVIVITTIGGVIAIFSNQDQPIAGETKEVVTVTPPKQFGQYKADEIPQTGIDVFQSLPSNDYHVSMRRGRCHTMNLHLLAIKDSKQDSEDYAHAKKAILLLSQEMLNDYTAKPGLRNDSRASQAVWSDPKGFAESREALVNTLILQMQKQKQGESFDKKEEITQITTACMDCHQKYTISEGSTIDISN